MKTLRLLSWNVNGLRAVAKKGFGAWLARERPDILCLQETKAEPAQVPADLAAPEGYHIYYNTGTKKGYSGVALYSRVKPASVKAGFGLAEFDGEGRTLIADYGPFLLFNIYFPNGQSSAARLAYKMAFYDAFLKYADKEKAAGRGVVVAGDFNTALREIDLARPKENQKRSGFLPEERAWLDKFISHGYVDTFRMFDARPGQYSYWDVKSRARERNVGWRIDYFFVSDDLKRRVKAAFILPEVMGSDHCPVGIELAVPARPRLRGGNGR